MFLLNEKKPLNLYLNMALDEVLTLSSAEPEIRGVDGFLRFYMWDRPCVSFGYAQSYQKVLADNPGMPLVRRPSGGGAVRHGLDLTYSVVLFPPSRLFSKNRMDLYVLFHSAVKAAFSSLGIVCEIRDENDKGAGYYRCFDKPVFGDVVLPDGRKIAGAAQKHSRDAILTQGSVSVDIVGVAREFFLDKFSVAIADSAGIVFESFECSESILSKAEELAKVKYSSDKWNMERKI